MSEGTRWKPQVVTWIISALCGGLGGSLLTIWYTNRSTVIEYSVNRTVLGTDQTTVLPNFHVQVEDKALQSVFIYTVKLQYRSGPELDNVKVGIGLTPSVKPVGKTVADRPGEVFGINCDAFESRAKSSGTTCVVGRFGPQVGAYAVSFATDADAKIEITVNAKNTQVKQAGLPGPAEPTSTMWYVGFAVSTIILVLGVVNIWRLRVMFKEDQRVLGGQIEGGETTITNDPASRPVLEIDYEGAEANRVDVLQKTGDTEVAIIYIRARVRNTGPTAKGALVYLTSLREVQTGGATTPTPFYDPMPLAWAGWKFQPQDIPQGPSFYVDLLRISKHTPGWLFSVEKLFGNQTSLKDYSGTYRFGLTVTADNAAPATCEIDVTYKQDWHTLRATAVPKAREGHA